MTARHRGRSCLTAFFGKLTWKAVKQLRPLGLSFLLSSPLVAISLGSLEFNGVFPRIFTPNSDGFNDKAVFHFTNPELLPVGGSVYDIPGSKVASLLPGNDPDTLLTWDGRDSGGRVVPGGIYFFKI